MFMNSKPPISLLPILDNFRDLFFAHLPSLNTAIISPCCLSNRPMPLVGGMLVLLKQILGDKDEGQTEGRKPRSALWLLTLREMFSDAGRPLLA